MYAGESLIITQLRQRNTTIHVMGNKGRSGPPRVFFQTACDGTPDICRHRPRNAWTVASDLRTKLETLGGVSTA
jgi:hypothetical protein